MAAISETTEDPGGITADHNGLDPISIEVNKISKKRKHENEIRDTEISDVNKQSKPLLDDDESDDGAFCPIVSYDISQDAQG